MTHIVHPPVLPVGSGASEDAARSGIRPSGPVSLPGPDGAVATAPASTPDGPSSASGRPVGAGYEDLVVVPARHPGRWLATAGVLLLLAMVANSLITNPRWEWETVAAYLTWSSVVKGVGSTLLLTVVASVVGFALGTVLALMRLSRSPLLKAVSWGYTWVFRSVPLILQLLLWYNLAFLYPKLTVGIPFGPSFASVDTLEFIGKFGAAILGLGLSQAAYSAEIVRGGILSVDQGQHEAAAALGIPRARQSTRIVLPQAMRTIVPTAVNEVIGLLKGTSVVYILAYSELFYIVQVIIGRTTRVVPLLLVAAIWYFVLTTVITVLQYYVERHYAKGALRALPPTPLQQARWWAQVTWSRLTGRPAPSGLPPAYLARATARRGVLLRTASGDRRQDGWS